MSDEARSTKPSQAHCMEARSMNIKPWTQPPDKRERGFCLCGNKAIPKKDKCERCRDLESMGRRGLSGDSERDIPRTSLSAILRGCNAALESRGLSVKHGQSYLSEE